jgi:hypothetical protein
MTDPKQTSTTQPCTWIKDSDGNWETGCGEIFTFTDAGPSENAIKFCGYCGKRIQEVEYVELQAD